MDQKYIRPAKKIALNRWYDSFSNKDDLSVFQYTNAVVLPLKKTESGVPQFGLGGVISEDKYVPQSGIEGRVGGLYEYQEPSFCNQKVVYCGALINQWGHFLVESVSRLWYFLRDDQTIDKYVFISNESHFADKNQIKGNYRSFFELLGIWDCIEIITNPIKYKEVLVPELGYSRKHYYSSSYKAIFQRVAENALLKCRDESVIKRVFLSRSQFSKASENEFGLEMLDDYFNKNGFMILYPESLPLEKMIWFLWHAETCAAESGTVPHNFLFCQDGKDCIIVERQATINEIQANIDIIKKQDITYIDGFYMLYPTSAGYGPYILAYNDLFASFSESRGFISPDRQYMSERYLKKCLQLYFRAYKKAYGYQWGFEKWQLMYANIYYEAYEDSCKAFGHYLTREKPLFWTDYFDPHIVKCMIRDALRKNKQE